MKNLSAKFLKIPFVVLISVLFVTSCVDEDLFETVVEAQKETVTEVQKPAALLSYVQEASIPDIMKEIKGRAVEGEAKSTMGKISYNNVDIDLTSIMRVVDKEGRVNYTFALDVKKASIYHIYNLVIGKDANGRVKQPYIIGYEMEPEDMATFFESGEDYSKFSTRYRYYTFRSFFADSKNGKVGKNGDCGNGNTGSGYGGNGHESAPGSIFTISNGNQTVSSSFTRTRVPISYVYTIRVRNNGRPQQTRVTTATSNGVALSTPSTPSAPVMNVGVPTGTTSVNVTASTTGNGGGTCFRVTGTVDHMVWVRSSDCGGKEKKRGAITGKGDCPDADGTVGINTASKAVQKLYYYLNESLSKTEIDWLQAHQSMTKKISEYLLVEKRSNKSKKYSKKGIEKLLKGEKVDFPPPPSCKSFKFERVTGTYFEALVKNIKFKIVLIEINNAGVKVKKVHSINFPQATKFGVPAVLSNGSVITTGLAAELSAKAIKESINEIKDSYEGLLVNTESLRLEFMDALRKNQREYANGGRVNFNDMTSNLSPTEYQTSAFWDDKCR